MEYLPKEFITAELARQCRKSSTRETPYSLRLTRTCGCRIACVFRQTHLSVDLQVLYQLRSTPWKLRIKVGLHVHEKILPQYEVRV